MAHSGGQSSESAAGAPPPRLAIDLADATGTLTSADLTWLQDHARQLGAALRLSGIISAKVVGDEEMAEVHQEFCGVEGTTDVITFDLTDPDDQAASRGVVEADLVLCYDEAERQATQRGHEVRRELLLYIIHGVLHCLGHDDHDEAAYEKMHAEEDRLMALLGVGATFASEKRRLGGER